MADVTYANRSICRQKEDGIEDLEGVISKNRKQDPFRKSTQETDTYSMKPYPVT